MPANGESLLGEPTGKPLACSVLEGCESGEGKCNVVENPVTASRIFPCAMSFGYPAALYDGDAAFRCFRWARILLAEQLNHGKHLQLLWAERERQARVWLAVVFQINVGSRPSSPTYSPP